jgi:UDP-glucose 4-epimerase
VGVNLELTRKAIELARRHAKRLVLVSSVAVYGDPSQLPVDEMSPLDPVGPYGRSKIESEDAVRDSGLPFVIVQPSITYGPGDTNGMMEKILRMVAARFFVVPGLGRSRVQLIYIDDVANALLTACEAPAAIGSRFICTYRDPIAMADLVRLSGRAVGTWIPPIGPPVALLKAGASALDALDAAGFFRGREPPLTREKLATVAVDHAYRIDRMRQVLGFEPAIGYEEGFRRTAQALGLGPGMR